MAGDEMITPEVLLAKYDDDDWRRRFVAASDAAILLRHSVIGPKYRVSDKLNDIIKLNEEGSAAQQTLISKHEVPPKEARLICFLEMFHREFWLDLDRIDFELLFEEISKQIRDRALRYPLIFGREVYDRAADQLPDLRAQLDYDETAELLEGSPQGVFHVGEWVTGPLGLVRSPERRDFHPRLEMNLQHCSDASCAAVHSTRLSTSYEAPINVHLSKFRKAFPHDASSSEAWARFGWAITQQDEGERYTDYHKNILPVTLGDCFSESELATIAKALHSEGCIIDPTALDVVKRLPEEDGQPEADRASLLQVIWSCANSAITKSVDRSIEAGDVRIPDGERRRPVVADYIYGPFSLGVEYTRHGSRVVSHSQDLAPLRLRSLITSLYDLNDAEEVAEIEWLLRDVDGLTANDRIEQLIWTQSPDQVIQTLVMSRRRNIKTALDALSIDWTGGFAAVESGGRDNDFVQWLLWKLGFPWLPASRNLHKVRADADRLLNILHAAAVAPVFDMQRLREAATTYFVELERVLRESVEFAWWSLTNDHYISERPFTFSAEMGDGCWPQLQSLSDGQSGSERLNLHPESRRTLYHLTQAFRVLADFLNSLKREDKRYLREAAEMPEYVNKTTLKIFPFRHTVPFLDLLSQSQEEVVSTLLGLSADMKKAKVNKTRNDLAHYQRSALDVEAAISAVSASLDAVRTLERTGLAPTTFAAEGRLIDAWGRRQHRLVGTMGEEFTFGRPSPYQSGGMPSLGVNQLIVPIAKFAPQEMLRFKDRAESDFTRMWEGYPRRRADWRNDLRQAAPHAADVARESSTLGRDSRHRLMQ